MEVRTLTPLWTGGIGGKVDRIHETGLLGSLRWWYEVLVRGMGGEVHDFPRNGGESRTDDCNFKIDKYANAKASDESRRLKEAGICDVCQIFGTTGWKRRFRLSIAERNIKDAVIQHPIRVTEKKYINDRGIQRIPTWYFPDHSKADIKPTPTNTPKIGNFEIYIQSLYHDFSPDVINGLIQFIADWGALGARAQMGFGVIESLNGRFNTRPLYDRLTATAGNRQYAEMPALNNIFLARIKLKNAKEVDVFKLKYDLRRLFSADRELRHFIMGTIKGKERMAAKVKISRPYGDGLIRIWSWVPEVANCYKDSWDRNGIVEAIHSHLIKDYDLEVWREMNSLRDTVTPNTVSADKFVQSLLAIEEE